MMPRGMGMRGMGRGGDLAGAGAVDGEASSLGCMALAGVFWVVREEDIGAL